MNNRTKEADHSFQPYTKSSSQIIKVEVHPIATIQFAIEKNIKKNVQTKTLKKTKIKIQFVMHLVCRFGMSFSWRFTLSLLRSLPYFSSISNTCIYLYFFIFFFRFIYSSFHHQKHALCIRYVCLRAAPRCYWYIYKSLGYAKCFY